MRQLRRRQRQSVQATVTKLQMSPPDKALVRRYRAALNLLVECPTPGQRISLLVAVVWPEDERLRRAA